MAVARLRGELSLATLADKTALVVQILNAVEDPYYMISADTLIAIEGLTVGDGPLIVGLAHGDYSVAEIKEAIENKNMFTSDQIAIEQGRRKVRETGILIANASEFVMNDGKSVRTKLKFRLEVGQVLNAFVYNDSGSPLTTGAEFQLHGKVYAKRS